MHTIIATREDDSTERTMSLEQFGFVRCSATTSSAVTLRQWWLWCFEQRGLAAHPPKERFNSDWVEGQRRDACGLNMTRTTAWYSTSGVIALIRMSIGTSLSKGAFQKNMNSQGSTKHLYNFGVMEFVKQNKMFWLWQSRNNHWQPVICSWFYSLIHQFQVNATSV